MGCSQILCATVLKQRLAANRLRQLHDGYACGQLYPMGIDEREIAASSKNKKRTNCPSTLATTCSEKQRALFSSLSSFATWSLILAPRLKPRCVPENVKQQQQQEEKNLLRDQPRTHVRSGVRRPWQSLPSLLHTDFLALTKLSAP